MISICVLRLTICLLIISFKEVLWALCGLSVISRRERRTGHKAFLLVISSASFTFSGKVNTILCSKYLF